MKRKPGAGSPQTPKRGKEAWGNAGRQGWGGGRKEWNQCAKLRFLGDTHTLPHTQAKTKGVPSAPPSSHENIREGPGVHKTFQSFLS